MTEAIRGDAEQASSPTPRVAIVGLGKIGLPLAVQFAQSGATVTGYDIDPARVATIDAGHNPLAGEAGLEALPTLVETGVLRATTDPRDAVAGAGVIALIVPVDVDEAHHPDFAALDAATDAIAPHVRRDALVIVETTVPVGTTRNRVGARIAASGLTPGRDFALAFSPERVSSGTVLRDLRIYPKVVGGIDAASTERAAAFYRQMLAAPDVIELRDAETAEFSKLAETTYRDVNIALANEFARIADRLGVDALQAIAASNTQPYSHIHRPGPGVGGHCIPVYPYFLADDVARLIPAAREINDGMAAYTVDRLRDALGTLDGATVIVLGLAYRANVKEWRHSSAFGLAGALRGDGARVFVHDPLFTPEEIRAGGLEPTPAFPMPADALVVQAQHDVYRALDYRAFAALRAVADPRGALDPASVTSLGLRYVAVGR
jgi:nucleotide sugar dehydrogenase